MTDDATSQPDDTALWPLVEVLGDIARRVERDEQAESTDSDSDEATRKRRHRRRPRPPVKRAVAVFMELD